jgi:hypothetical protein
MPGLITGWLAQAISALHCNTQDRPENQNEAATHA